MGQPLSANRSNLQAVTVAHRYAAFGSGNIDAAAKVTFDFFDGLTGEWAHSHGTWQLVETRKWMGRGEWRSSCRAGNGQGRTMIAPASQHRNA